MTATENVIQDLNVAVCMLCSPEMLTPEIRIRIGQAIHSATVLLEKHKVRELTIDEWREWKSNKNRDPICRLWEDDTSPIWTLNPNDVHEPALLMGKLKLFTGKPTLEQRKEVSWNE